MSLRNSFGVILLVMCAVAAHTTLAATPVSQQNVSAFAVWIGKGNMQKTGPDQVTFGGSIGGQVYIETEEGPILAGRAVCPINLQIRIADKSERGDGKCTITTKDGTQVYGEWSCTGFFLVGCSGDFKFTGGNGRFAGIGGAGKVTVRADMGALTKTVQDTYQTDAEGIMFWRQLSYRIP